MFPNAKYDDQVDSTSQGLDAIGNPQIKGFPFLQIARQINNTAPGPAKAAPREVFYAVGSVEWGEQQAAMKAREGEAARLAVQQQAPEALKLAA